MPTEPIFRFYRPHPLLRPYVRHYWALQSSQAISNLTYPIGCPQIIFHRKSPLYIPELDQSQHRLTISGQVNFPSHIQTAGEVEMIVAVFHPHGLTPLLGFPISEAYNREISGYDAGDATLRTFADKIFESDDITECILMIESWLLSRLPIGGDTLNLTRIGRSISLLLSDTSTRVGRMADTACLGKKQFERIFFSSVGMKPKEYARIVRFQKALHLMQSGESDFCGISHLCGYSDQSHFIRDFKTYSGLTPRSLLHSHLPYSDLFSSPFSSII